MNDRRIAQIGAALQFPKDPVTISPAVDAAVIGGDEGLRAAGYDPDYISSIRLCSWGKKKGARGVVKTFKRRFFVLVGAVRIDYHDTDAKVSILDSRTRKGTIALVPQSIVEYDSVRPCTLSIYRARPEMDRIYVVTFDDEETVRTWYQVLTQRIAHWAYLAFQTPFVRFQVPNGVCFSHPVLMEFQRSKSNRVEVYVLDCGVSASIISERIPYAANTNAKYAEDCLRHLMDGEPEWRKVSEEVLQGGPYGLPYVTVVSAFDKSLSDTHVSLRSIIACHVAPPSVDPRTKEQIYIGHQFSMSVVYQSDEQWFLYAALFKDILASLYWPSDNRESEQLGGFADSDPGTDSSAMDAQSRGNS
jgi:hypothetical protein